MPPPARRTLTCDNGGEFAAHGRVTAWTEVAAYFCDPGCPGQRGSIENTHGRLRVPLPRSIKLAEIPDAEIAGLLHNLNTTPRQCLGWRTPLEAFNQQLAAELPPRSRCPWRSRRQPGSNRCSRRTWTSPQSQQTGCSGRRCSRGCGSGCPPSLERPRPKRADARCALLGRIHIHSLLGPASAASAPFALLSGRLRPQDS